MPESKGRVWTDEEEKKIVDLYRNGTPTWEIAAVLQRAEKAVRKRLRSLGEIVT